MEEKKVFELTEEQLHAPISKQEAKKCKHRLERRWYRRLIELNIIMIVVVIALFASEIKGTKKALQKDWKMITQDVKAIIKDSSQSSKKGTKADKKKIKKTKDQNEKKLEKDIKKISKSIPEGTIMFFGGIAAIFIFFFSIYAMYAYYRSMALRITEKNFPEVYEIIEEYAHRLGIEVPKAYVMQSNGILNAFSAFIYKKQWIQINSEMFEVAYREHHDIDALKFIIAHEMSHIYYGHATLHYNLPIFFSMGIPVIGATASRTREYSADRLAQRLSGVDGIDSMLVLVVDRHLYKMVDKEDYVREMRSKRGFFIWLTNLLADHPIMCKRIVALEEGKGSGKLY